MVFSLEFPPGWYAAFALYFLLWVFLAYFSGKAERKHSLLFGIIALILGLVAEAVGIGLGLWNYTGGNWPVILWPCYFIAGAASYLVFQAATKKKRA